MFVLTGRISNNVSMASSVYSRCYAKDSISTVSIVRIFLENAQRATNLKLKEIGYNNDEQTRSLRSKMITIDGLIRESLNNDINNERFNQLILEIYNFKLTEEYYVGQTLHQNISDIADFKLKSWYSMLAEERTYFIDAVRCMISPHAEEKINTDLLAFYKETDEKFQELIIK